ncbi:MAG: type II toxin-antitoxin system HipA family toxin [Ramlibacter sp.]
MADEYLPRDTLSLWWLGDPAHPQRTGDIQLVQGGRSVGLRYDAVWRSQGFALSADLPLVDELFVPTHKDTAVGALDDARPDRWGERVIRKFQPTPRLSLLEYLLFAGDDRYGALGVSLDPDIYRPWTSGPLPGFDQLEAMADAVRRVLANEPVPELQRRLVRPGASLGGARPKSLLQMDGRAWLVKFNEDDELDTPLIEYAAMTLARCAGIDVAETRPLPLPQGHAVAIGRFDRQGPWRLHAMSAHVALRAAGEVLGYPEFAQQLRRLLPAADISAWQAQWFRRMVFNILIDNTDDHEKNHALLRSPQGRWSLAPAFDVLPTAQGLGYQQLHVGEAGTESTLANALSGAAQFGLKPAAAREVVREICAVVDGWVPHFRACGVREAEIEHLARFINRQAVRRL